MTRLGATALRNGFCAGIRLIRFPTFNSLTIDNYGLFPGEGDGGRVELLFRKGPTLIAGVNGLGKSTLVGILLRLLSGPFDLPGPAQDGDLGEVEPVLAAVPNRTTFAARVADGAQQATAELAVHFGEKRLSVTRRLRDLSLVTYRIDDSERTESTESSFQDDIVGLMGTANFFDCMLIMRYVVFFLEDRRALVWGKTAQRELLRALFVPKERASRLSDLRYSMLSADSAYRNLRSVLNRRIKDNETEIRRLSSASGVRAELSVLEADLDGLRDQEEELSSDVARLEARRDDARARGAGAAQRRDSSIRDLERAKVSALRSAFSKTQDENLLYVLARLEAEDFCLACETRSKGLGSAVASRLAHSQCPVCGTPTGPADNKSVLDLSAARIQELQQTISACEVEVVTTAREIETVSAERRTALEGLAAVSQKKLDTAELIRARKRHLPTTDRSADDLDERNRELRALIEEEKLQYEERRTIFEDALQQSQVEVGAEQNSVAEAFARFANEFLRETCRISFQPMSVRIGQTGAEFRVNLFQLALSGGAVGGETPRSEPDQVSMSQKEFLDLAFRMALMEVASGGGSGTLVVDTPEASLDFLFAERAGNQLARFARGGGRTGNRVIVTSNLANPDLIPALLRGRPDGDDARSRVVDLLQLAVPNAAVREDGPRYEAFLKERVDEAERPR